MVATRDIHVVDVPKAGQLKHGALSLPETMMLFLGLVIFAAFPDIQVSSRIDLGLETISISIIIIAIIVEPHGGVVYHRQLDLSSMNFGGVRAAMASAVFCFVGFESAATRVKESANAHCNVSFALIGSAALAGTFFTVMSYSWYSA